MKNVYEEALKKNVHLSYNLEISLFGLYPDLGLGSFPACSHWRRILVASFSLPSYSSHDNIDLGGGDICDWW